MTDIGSFSHVLINLGGPGSLSPEDALKAAASFLTLLSSMPRAEFHLSIDGYDKDERSIWEVPEAREFVLRFALGCSAVLKRPVVDWQLDQESVLLIAMCSGQARVISTNPLTGLSTFEIGNGQN